MECNQIHIFYPPEEAEEDDKEEDLWRAQRELNDWVEEQISSKKFACCNRNNQMVKIFNLKCVICWENLSVYAIRHCGHQCICKNCRTNSNVEMSKCVVCRT